MPGFYSKPGFLLVANASLLPMHWSADIFLQNSEPATRRKNRPRSEVLHVVENYLLMTVTV